MAIPAFAPTDRPDDVAAEGAIVGAAAVVGGFVSPMFCGTQHRHIRE
jgi:hypothetical protein